jgi:hypothetical protein
MKLILITLLVAITTGYLLGGRLSNISNLRIRWAPLAIVGLAMQMYNPPGRWPLAMLFGSFVLLSVFAIANRKVAGFTLILVGVALNFIVIGVNSGMPVAMQALEASGQLGTISGLTNDADSYVKHHLATSEDKLIFLGDVMGIAPPVSQAISLGDIFSYGGVAMVIVTAMRREPRKDEGDELVPVPVGEPQGVGG